jgi:hypothetical protein
MIKSAGTPLFVRFGRMPSLALGGRHVGNLMPLAAYQNKCMKVLCYVAGWMAE